SMTISRLLDTSSRGTVREPLDSYSSQHGAPPCGECDFTLALRYDFTSIRLSKGLSPSSCRTCSAHNEKGHAGACPLRKSLPLSHFAEHLDSTIRRSQLLEELCVVL